MMEHLDSPLRDRVAKSGFWSFMLRFNHQIFFVGKIVVLARLLSPGDFGLMGIALLTMSFLDTFTQTGMFESLIQKKAKSEEYLNAAWTFNVGRGIFVFAALILISFPAGRFFHAPAITQIIQVLGLSVLFMGFTNIGVMYFQKELEFKKQFLLQSSMSITNFFIAVPCALIFKNVWALVIGELAGHLVRMVMSYILHPYRPRFDFNLSKIRELLKFGKWVLGSSMLLFFLLQGDDLFVGKLLGTAALGFYHLAYKFSNIPTTEVGHVIAQVSFPVYAKLQSDPGRLKKTFLLVLQLTAFVCFPVSALIAIAAPEFVIPVLGEKWLPLVIPTQLLCIYGLTRAIHQTTSMVFFGMGKPKVTTVSDLIQLIFMAVLIYPLTLHYGIIGTIVAIILPNFAALLYIVSKLVHEIDIKWREYLATFSLPLLFTLSMSSFVLGMKVLFLGNLLIFCLSIAAGIGLAFGITYSIDKSFYSGIQIILRQVISKTTPVRSGLGSNGYLP